MPYYRDYRTSIWDKKGDFVTYLPCSFFHTAAMGDVGQAEFTIDINNPLNRRDIIATGNYVLFEHQRLGDWAGIIAPNNGLSWTGDGVRIVRALEAAHQFSRRRSPLYVMDKKPLAVVGNAGLLLKKVINYANAKQDALLRPGNILPGDIALIHLKYEMTNELVHSLERKSKCESWVTPEKDETGRLIFRVHLARRRGAARGYTLREGINLELEHGDIYREDGAIINDYAAIVQTESGYQHAQYEDRRSIYENGLWQGSEQDGEGEPKYLVRNTVAANRDPVRTYKVTAIETPESPDTFAYIGLGDVVNLCMYNGGAYYNEAGVDTSVRIVSREYSSTENKVILTVEEEEENAIR